MALSITWKSATVPLGTSGVFRRPHRSVSLPFHSFWRTTGPPVRSSSQLVSARVLRSFFKPSKRRPIWPPGVTKWVTMGFKGNLNSKVMPEWYLKWFQIQHCRKLVGQFLFAFFLFFLAFMEGPTLDPPASAQSKRSFSFQVCSRKSCGFCVKFGSISGPKGFQFESTFDFKTDSKTDPSPNLHL